jgi:phosphohistidine phosphatase
MPQLLIVRHAIAEERDEATRLGHSDAERPLTPKGSKRMKAIAAGIARQIPAPQYILSSPLLRARQSAEILATRFPGTTITIERGLIPGAPLAQLVARLDERIDEGTGILVGHEPDLSTLVSLLLFGKESAAIQLKKGGAALLDFPRHIASGQATLLWLMTPRQLRTPTDNN